MYPQRYLNQQRLQLWVVASFNYISNDRSSPLSLLFARSSVQSSTNSAARGEVALSQQSYRLDNFLTTNHRDVVSSLSPRPNELLTRKRYTAFSKMTARESHSSEHTLGSELFFKARQRPASWMLFRVPICYQDPNGGETSP